jgi:hypothetical protein
MKLDNKHTPKFVGLESSLIQALIPIIARESFIPQKDLDFDFFKGNRNDVTWVIPTRPHENRMYFEGSIQEKLCDGIISFDSHPYSTDISHGLCSYLKKRCSKRVTRRYNYVLFEPSSWKKLNDFYSVLKKLLYVSAKNPDIKILVVCSEHWHENATNLTFDAIRFKENQDAVSFLSSINEVEADIHLFFDDEPGLMQILMSKLSYVHSLTSTKNSNGVFVPLLGESKYTPDSGDSATQWFDLLHQYHGLLIDAVNQDTYKLVTQSKRPQG